MSYIDFRETTTIDLNRFAQDFVNFIANREQRTPPRVSLVVVTDERWDQLLAVANPCRIDPGNIDQRVGIAYAVKEPIHDEEIPDLIKTFFPELAKVMPTSDLIVVLNEETLTHPDDFNSIFNHLIILCEKALWMHGYPNLNPIADSVGFGNSAYFRVANYVCKK